MRQVGQTIHSNSHIGTCQSSSCNSCKSSQSFFMINITGGDTPSHFSEIERLQEQFMILCLVWLGGFRRKGSVMFIAFGNSFFSHEIKRKRTDVKLAHNYSGDILVCVWLPQFSHFSGLCGLLCSSIQRKRFVASVLQHLPRRYAMQLVKTSSDLFHLSTI